jgi:hypothetical protein
MNYLFKKRITVMKTLGIVLAWFVFIGTLAFLVSCKSSSHCDAYSQEKQSTNTKDLSR